MVPMAVPTAALLAAPMAAPMVASMLTPMATPIAGILAVAVVAIQRTVAAGDEASMAVEAPEAEHEAARVVMEL